MRTDPQGCARSRDNYPAFLADWLDVASYTDVTCSAAVTADLYEPMTMFDGNTARPQLDAVTAETDLVTIGIGGNDFSIYDSLIQCQGGAGLPGRGADAPTPARSPAGSRRRCAASSDAAPEADGLRRGLPRHPPDRGHLPAPSAYRPTCWARWPTSPASSTPRCGRARRQPGRRTSTWRRSPRGTTCAPRGSAWVNGPRFRAGVAAPFHPKVNGMRAVAVEVYTMITGEEPRGHRVRRARPRRHRAQRGLTAPRRSGRSSRGNCSGPKMVISVICPPVIRRTSTDSGR